MLPLFGRKGLTVYLQDKMSNVAPNLATLIGDTVGARLISHAGSLTNLVYIFFFLKNLFKIGCYLI